MCSAPRRIPQLRPGASAHPLFGPGRDPGWENPAQVDHGSAITAGVPPTRHEIPLRVFATIPAGGRRAAVAGGRAARGLGELAWAGRSGRGPLARTAGAVPGRRPAINCQKFTALCLFKPSRRTSLIRPGKNPPAVSREAMRDFGAIVRCRGRLSGWLARPRGKTAGGARPESPAPPCRGRRPAGRGAGTSPQPGLTVL